jgi:hypothetical protein
LCCGHGLTGILFAVFERTIERVYLVDTKRPRSFDKILEAAVEVAPWVADKVQWIEMDVQRLADDPTSVLPAGTTVVAIHACGNATDLCIQAGIKLGGTMVLMPCCYQPPPPLAGGLSLPTTLQFELGIDLACDIHRTYQLQAVHRYQVDWAAIPKAITPKNRLLISTPAKDALVMVKGASSCSTDTTTTANSSSSQTLWCSLALLCLLLSPALPRHAFLPFHLLRKRLL